MRSATNNPKPLARKRAGGFALSIFGLVTLPERRARRVSDGFFRTTDDSVQINPLAHARGSWFGSLRCAVCGVLALALTGCERSEPPAPVDPPAAARPETAPPSAQPALRLVVVSHALDPESTIRFTFPAPLEIYGGEAKDFGGELTIDPGLSPSTLRGFIEVKTASVTLGEPDIDENAHSAMFMGVEKHPTSRFTIREIVPTPDKPGAFTMRGPFTLKGYEIEIEVPATLEPVAPAGPSSGADVWTLNATWEINILKPFGIPGPSSDPAAERVIFTTAISLRLEK
ncbi:MAG: YceI family protein [Phycisphaerales bacterium]